MRKRPSKEGTYKNREGTWARGPSLLQGTWALIIIDINCPNKLWATRNGSPLNIGYTESLAMICSEASGFGNYVTQYAPIDNHCVTEITFENDKIRRN